MIEKLTKEDIKELRYSCRIGILMAIALFVFGAVGLFVKKNGETNVDGLPLIKFVTMIVLLLSVSFILAYLVNRKYILDLQKGVKEVIPMNVQEKIYIVDYEAGSGTLIGKEMKPFDSYSLVIDGIKYRVDKDLYNKVNEGEEVYFHLAPVSEVLLKISLHPSY